MCFGLHGFILVGLVAPFSLVLSVLFGSIGVVWSRWRCLVPLVLFGLIGFAWFSLAHLEVLYKHQSFVLILKCFQWKIHLAKFLDNLVYISGAVQIFGFVAVSFAIVAMFQLGLTISAFMALVSALSANFTRAGVLAKCETVSALEGLALNFEEESCPGVVLLVTIGDCAIQSFKQVYVSFGVGFEVEAPAFGDLIWFALFKVKYGCRGTGHVLEYLLYYFGFDIRTGVGNLNPDWFPGEHGLS